jgi:hypothetical protein
LKSPAKNSGSEQLIFFWDWRVAATNPEIRGITPRDFESYFEFLEEIKPHPQELTEITKYTFPFHLDPSIQAVAD